jgi:hypothetical protein
VGVELYFVRPDAAGRVVFPFWDERGEPLGDVEHRMISSLKWACGKDCLIDADIGLCDFPIPPAQLVEGAARGLRILLGELAAMHPDFRKLADEAGDDVAAIDGLLYAFEERHDWLGGDAEARERAFTHAMGESASLHWLLLEIRKAGQDGFHGCWSF